MHLKLTKHGRFCIKQNNQLPTKSHDELDDNSNLQVGFYTNNTPSHVNANHSFMKGRGY